MLLDQFSRNLFRDDPRAFEADPLARALAREALAKGWGVAMSEDERKFLHMPFMHSEDMDDQVLSLRLFGPEDEWARAHAAQIARFGRFPQRNAALGRGVDGGGGGVPRPAGRAILTRGCLMGRFPPIGRPSFRTT